MRRSARTREPGDLPFGAGAVYLREKVACFYCGRMVARWGIEITVDHVTPRSRGGPDSLGNRVPACITCNRAKGNKHWAEFILSLPVARQQMVSVALKDHDKAFPFTGRKPKTKTKERREPRATIPTKLNERITAAANAMAANAIRQSGEPRRKDVAWFKARINDARDLLKDGRVFDAALLLDAVAGLPASCLPGQAPEQVAELIEQRRVRERPFLDALFVERGMPCVIGGGGEQ